MGNGLFGTFDYDRDMMQPPAEREEHDPDEWVCVSGRWVYVGDE